MACCVEESPYREGLEGGVAMLRSGGCHVGKQPQDQSNKHPSLRLPSSPRFPYHQQGMGFPR